MKKRLLAFILTISIIAMLIPMETFAVSPLIQAYIGSQGTTSVTVSKGDTVTLTASVTGYGGNMSLQWYKASSANLSDDGTTVAAIDGAVGTTYEAPTDTVGTYYYYCAGNHGDYKSGVLTVTVNDPVDTVAVSADPVSGGTVSGAGTYSQNSPCTLTATPSAGFAFAGWKENGAVVSTDAQYTFTVSGDRTLSASFTDTITVNNIQYKISSLNPVAVSVVGNSLTENTAVTLPQSLDYKGIDYKVTSIGDGAFDGCTSLSSITIPSSVSNIGYSAFDGCTALTSVTISSGVTSIGARAFNACKALSNITIPSSVTSIGDYAFRCCAALSSITIPNNVTSIGEGAFSICTSLSNIIIPNNVTSIGECAFGVCTALSSITIPSSVTNIRYDSFDGIPSNAVFYSDTPERPDEWGFWLNSYRYAPIGSAVITTPTAISGVGSVVIKSPGNDLGNVSAVLTPVSDTTTATLLAAANVGLPGGTYQVVGSVEVTFSGNTETLLVGQSTTFSFQLTGDTSQFDMSRAEVVHQYGSSVEVLPASWNATTSVISAVDCHGASPFVIVAPLRTAEHTVDNPDTGDNLFIPFWITLAVLASGVMALSLIFARKRKKQF